MSLYFQWKSEIDQDPAQKAALEANGNAVVIAGPGSGKTRVLALKVAQLLKEEISLPQGVACLTYTRVMAKELEERLRCLGISERPNITVSTVHGFCLGEVLRPFMDIFDTGIPRPIRIAPQKVQEKILYDLQKQLLPNTKLNSFKNNFFVLRRRRVDFRPEQWEDNRQYLNAMNLYQERLFSQGYIDFDIIVEKALKLLLEQSIVRNMLSSRFPWFVVDEYQDLGYPLFRIVTEMLDRTDIHLFAIGDPDQSIYDFMGTDPKYLLALKDRNDVTPYELIQNYRCANEVMEVAYIVLGQKRPYTTINRNGRIRCYFCPNKFPQQIQTVCRLVKDYLDKGFDPNEIAIFTKYRNQLNDISKALLNQGIEFAIDKSEFYDRSKLLIKWLEELGYWCLKGWNVQDSKSSRWAFDDLLSTWLEFGRSKKMNFPEDTNHARIYFAKVLWDLRKPNQLLSEWLKTIIQSLDLGEILEEYKNNYPDEVSELYKLQEAVSPGQPLENLTLEKFSNVSPCIKLTTLHSSKGTEFDIVILAGVENAQAEYDENEKRLLYVAFTRSRKYLDILFSKYIDSRINREVFPYSIRQLTKAADEQKWDFFTRIRQE